MVVVAECLELDAPEQIVHRKRIGELLIEAGIIRSEQLPLGLKESGQRSLKLGEVLVMLRYLCAEDLESVLLAQSMLHEGSLSESQAVRALQIASSQKIPFEQALTALAEPEAQHERLAKLLQELQDAERTHGPQKRELAGLLLQVGDAYADLLQYRESEHNYRRALQIIERSFGQRNLKAAGCLAKIAALYITQGKLADAEPLYWRVLDITQGAWGPEHREVALCHQSLARLFERQGRLKEAEQFYLSSLRILERVYGDNHQEVTDALRKLAAFWKKQGKKPERKRLGDLLVESGLIDQEQLQAGLQKVQQTGSPLGQALVQLGHLSEDQLRPALQAQLLVADGVLPLQLAVHALNGTKGGRTFQEALQDLGWDPDTFTPHELKSLIAAAEELVSAESELGPGHSAVAVLSMKLADVYAEQKKFAEAEPLYKRAIAVLEQSGSVKNSEMANGLYKYAVLNLLHNKLLDAERLLWRALEIRQQTHGQEHPDVSDCLDQLALVEQKRSNPEQAERLYQSALSIREKTLGKTHDKTIETLARLADVFYEQQKLPEAETTLLRLVRAKQSRQDVPAEDVALLLERLGDVYFNRKEYPKAETQFELALEIRESSQDNSDRLADLLEKYSILLETTGRTEESWKMMERAQIMKRTRS